MENTPEYINLFNDVMTFVKSHPVLSGIVASWVATSESLPFVKKVKSNGLVHMIINIFIAGLKATSKKGE